MDIEELVEVHMCVFSAARRCKGKVKGLNARSWEKKQREYVGFIDLEKAYDKINKEALWQVLRMYDVGDLDFSTVLKVCMLIV